MVGASQNLIAASEIQSSGGERVEGQRTEGTAGSKRGPGVTGIRGVQEAEAAGREDHVRSRRIRPNTLHADGAIRLRWDAVIDRGPREPSVDAPLHTDGRSRGVEG